MFNVQRSIFNFQGMGFAGSAALSLKIEHGTLNIDHFSPINEKSPLVGGALLRRLEGLVSF